MSPPPTDGAGCRACGRAHARVLFASRVRPGSLLVWGRSALRDPTLMKRSLGIAAVVGTVLLAINQGDVMLGSRWPPALLWKIPLTYLVPFLVATWGALLNSRVVLDGGSPPGTRPP